MEAEFVPQNVPNSGKKKKKKKKKNTQDESAQQNPDQNDNFIDDTVCAAFPQVTGETSGTQDFSLEANSSETPIYDNVQPAVKHSDDEKEGNSEESKEEILKPMTSGSTDGDVAAMIEGISKETSKEPSPKKSEHNISERSEREASSEIKTGPPLESRSESNAAGSRKRKKKKTSGFLLSDVNITESPKNSDKDKNDAKSKSENKTDETCANGGEKLKKDDMYKLTDDSSFIFHEDTKQRYEIFHLLETRSGALLIIQPRWNVQIIQKCKIGYLCSKLF